MENTAFSGEVSSQLGQAATSSEEDCGWETEKATENWGSPAILVVNP
jgi:hypothetical protein